MIENVLPDIPRLYTAIAEWASCLLFIIILNRRFSWIKTALISVGFLIVEALFLVLTKNVIILFWVPCMAIAYMLMTLFIMATCKIGKRMAFYFSLDRKSVV